MNVVYQNKKQRKKDIIVTGAAVGGMLLVLVSTFFENPYLIIYGAFALILLIRVMIDVIKRIGVIRMRKTRMAHIYPEDYGDTDVIEDNFMV